MRRMIFVLALWWLSKICNHLWCGTVGMGWDRENGKIAQEVFEMDDGGRVELFGIHFEGGDRKRKDDNKVNENGVGFWGQIGSGKEK